MEEVEGKEKGKTGTIKKETLFSFTKALYLANDSLETHSFYFFFFLTTMTTAAKSSYCLLFIFLFFGSKCIWYPEVSLVFSKSFNSSATRSFSYGHLTVSLIYMNFLIFIGIGHLSL